MSAGRVLTRMESTRTSTNTVLRDEPSTACGRQAETDRFVNSHHRAER